MSIFTGRARVAAEIAAVALLATLWLDAGPARAQTASPFVLPPPAKAKIVRLLAGVGFIDPRVLADYERASGWAVAYDAYASPEEIAEKWRDGPYDLVVVPGSALPRRIAAQALAKLDRAKLPNARATQSAVAAKLAAFDPTGAYSVAFGWFAFGLIYDADKAATRLGGAPVSWAQLLTPREAGRMADCGVALSDSRASLFVAAWRLMGVDPARATLPEVKAAATLIERARPAMQSMALRDVVGSLARGGICLTAGSQGEALAASERSREGGVGADIRFSYAKEGGAVTLEAYAIPRDAPTPAQAYALLDFLARPENAARDAKFAGFVSADDATQVEALKRLSPEGAFDERIAAAIAAEWTRLRAAK